MKPHRFHRLTPLRTVLDQETVEDIWGDALSVLAETGAEMKDGLACATLAAAGAKVDGTRVRFDPAMVQETIAKAPKAFSLAARDPSKSVDIGDTEIVAAPLYGATHILSEDGSRRRGTLADLNALLALAQSVPFLQNVGSNIIEPTDIAPALRHLHIMRSVLTRTDKPFMPVTTSRDAEVSTLNMAAVRARDSLAMASCVFGEDFGKQARMVGVATCLEPLTWSAMALQAIRLFAEAGQPVMLAPFAVLGKTAPPEPTAAITQITADILAGAVYAQLVAPSAPLLFGPHFVILGNGQTRVSAGPDAEMLILASGQMARRAGLPFRAVGGLTGAKIVDTQAATEGLSMLNASVSAGAHFLFHAAGWLDDGLTVSTGKFAVDSFMLDDVQRRQRSFTAMRGGIARAQLNSWGPGFDHVTNAGTQDIIARHYKASPVADYQSWDAWQASGAAQAEAAAREAIRRFPNDLIPLSHNQAAALDDFVERRSIEITRQLTGKQ